MNKERFLTVLSGQYAYLFTLPKYALVAARMAPEQLAAKVIHGLIDGTADKDGEGVKNTCKALGVPHTYKGIRAYLTKKEE